MDDVMAAKAVVTLRVKDRIVAVWDVPGGVSVAMYDATEGKDLGDPIDSMYADDGDA